MSSFVSATVQFIRNRSIDWWGLVVLGLATGLFLWIAFRKSRTTRSDAQGGQSMRLQGTVTALGIPSLSGINNLAPQITFNPQEFFRTAYYSAVTVEVENNMKIVAGRVQPNDREGFLAHFIGVGLTAYVHDMTWAYIFKSQLLMLMELNRRDGYMPVIDAKPYYDQALVNFPKVYEAGSTFDLWLNYLINQQILLRHQSDMLQITHRGKDFIKYLAHWGRDATIKNG